MLDASSDAHFFVTFHGQNSYRSNDGASSVLKQQSANFISPLAGRASEMSLVFSQDVFRDEEAYLHNVNLRSL